MAVLPVDVLERLRDELPEVAERTIGAVIAEVPEYTHAWQGGDILSNITTAVELALATFLRLAEDPSEEEVLLVPAMDAAYALGRGEARDTRTMDALLMAFRVGTRTAWREWSRTAVSAGLSADALAAFAELVFAFLDRLSASSASGHADELAVSGRVREKYLERLALALLDGDSSRAEVLAEQAEWAPPTSLTAVLVPAAQTRAGSGLDPRTLVLSGDVVGLPEHTVLLVVSRSRSALVAGLRRTGSVVGPTVAWAEVATSYRRAVRALGRAGEDVLDTDAVLAELVVAADPAAHADLREQVLAPLQSLRPGPRERLEETLRSWLLHQGRREAVAAELVVHPQTVRYRVTQLRELYGERLTDPSFVRDAVVAFAGRV